MSTTFAIRTYNPLKTTEVAHRSAGPNGTLRIKWLTKKVFPDNKKIFPLDNSAQGIRTIGDLRKLQ